LYYRTLTANNFSHSDLDSSRDLTGLSSMATGYATKTEQFSVRNFVSDTFVFGVLYSGEGDPATVHERDHQRRRCGFNFLSS